MSLLLALLAVAAVPPPVASIEILSEVDIPAELVAIEVGAPLAEDAVARTLTNVIAAGLASRVEVRRREEASGLIVQLVVWADPRIVDVTIEGEDLGLDQRVLRRELELAEGEKLIEDRVLRTVFAIQDLLVESGFRAARVRTKLEFEEEGRAARVAFAVEAGPRTRFGPTEVVGELGPFAPATLAEWAGFERGKPAQQETLERAEERLEERLIEEGHPAARVTLAQPVERTSAEGPRLDTVLEVAIGPRLVLEIEGAKRADLERRDLLPFTREAWDESLVNEAAEAIRRDLQQRGHWRAAVESSVERNDETIRVHLAVRSGPEWEVRSVSFEGNDSVAAETLEKLVATAPRRTLVPGSGRLVDQELAADRRNLLSYYRLEGWLDAVVEEPLVVADEGSRSLAVTFPIIERERRRIVRLEVEGLAPCLDEDEQPPELRVRAGGPWHPLLVEESEAALIGWCQRKGFGDALVRREASWNQAGTLVDLDLIVDAGPKVVIDRVILRGLARSEPDFVLRASGLLPGVPLSREELLAAERRLFRLGSFSAVDVEPAPRLPRHGRRDVVIRVREGRTQRLTYGFGYDSEDGIGGLLGYSHSNLAGRGYQLQVDLRPSESTNRFRVVLRRPEIGRRYPIGATLTLFADEEERPAFTVDRLGGRIEATRQWSQLRSSLGFDYRRVDLLELVGGGGDDAERELQDIEIASLIGQVFYDRRDDPVDPTRGLSSLLVVQRAFPAFQAEEDFLKLFAQQTLHFPLDALGTLALSARVGGIEPLDETRPIPVAERLYGGGRSSHRAFRRDRLGEPGETLDADGDPLGGNGLALVNVDWRFPLFGSVGGIVFVDGGNVWKDWRDIELGGLRWGAGIGVRYLSPVGPLRLEIGWPFEPEPYEDGYAVSFSFGNAF